MNRNILSSGRTLLLIAGLVLGTGVVNGASIQVSIDGVSCPGGLCTPVDEATTVDFESAIGSPYTVGIATYSYAGGESPFVIGSVPTDYTPPANDDTRYLTVGSPNRPAEVIIDFANPITYFGFYLGSDDLYNEMRQPETSESDVVVPLLPRAHDERTPEPSRRPGPRRPVQDEETCKGRDGPGLWLHPEM